MTPQGAHPSAPTSPEGGTRRRLRGLVRGNGVAVAAIVLVLAMWEVLPRALNVQMFIFPPLSAVIMKFADPTTTALLAQHAKVTVYEALVGLVIGVVAGVGLGFVLAEWKIVRSALYPFIVAFQAMPKVALAPLFIIWFGFGYTPKILVVVMLVFFPMLVNTMSGILATDASRLDLFQSLCASKWQIWSRLLLPSALPSIFAGLEVAVVNSFIGAITGEFVGATAGLGVMLQQYKTAYDTPGVFAVLVILALVGILLNQIVRLLRRRLIFWRA
ncbi:ABC transporter permease [Cellulomonas dongxiuzhuiae]|uniref:ABC transporter permease n=1 Tax=Cellulomonas dongxiuzhuiae TaxID=2819979 RepID=A0ABX8GFF5_9CELL|nr:ABC transporter permease [Cellulomonas dongxiuzhuiae]MBO3087138.1 ABC transporter permease [Cellulomonas dongxiuzhuiae]MBO3093503.1 ABC transporter permease [Cellulomonas dongxiuzhuiae]QWC14635.1 ABC transporter permease [Cellulomonas dongxiuzhuiae]